MAPLDPMPLRPCVGMALFNRQGLLFCGQRNDAIGGWQMPQGGLKPGEDPALAAMRELEEEIGCRNVTILARHSRPLTYIFPDHLAGNPYKLKYRGQEQIWFAMRFEGQDDEIDITRSVEGEPPEFSQWSWLDFDNVLARIVDFKRAVYEEIKREFDVFARPMAE
ncbi:MAG: RNA pyrophosphohydrolase [Alphaproteobacteria bacterium]|nr:MAG: RNA pyrophosphohydrolase [Alphaproteobacteria bacterium]